MFMRAEINLDAVINNEVSFYSTLGMSKFFNLSDRTSRSSGDEANFNSLTGSYAMRDSSARFDVAYVQYKSEASRWSLSIGRMTTNNGPLFNNQTGIGRSGTYHFFTYNVIFDGAAVVYSAPIADKNQSLKFRVFYTPFMNINSKDKTIQELDDEDNNDSWGDSDEAVDSHSPFLTLLTEYKKRSLSWAKEFRIFHSVYNFEKFYTASRQKLKTSSDACSNLSFGDQDIYNRFCRDGIEYAATTANTFYIGADDILGTGLGTSFTYNDFSVRNSGDDEVKGRNMMYTAHYRFDNKVLAGDVLGLEYIVTDEFHPPVDGTTFYINDFYNLINGQGYHVFFTWDLGSAQMLRLGHFSYESGVSDFLTRDIESKTTSSYLNWRVFF